MGGGNLMVRVALKRLDDVLDYPHLRLLAFEDVTTAHACSALTDRQRAITALRAVSETVAGSLDSQQVMGTALEQTLSVTAAETASIYLIDPDEPDHLRCAANLSRPNVPGEAPPWLDKNDSVCEMAIRQGKPVTATDADPNTKLSQQARDSGFRIVLAVPLVGRDQVLGALAVADRFLRHFTPAEEALLEGIGRLVGVALENARLHEEKCRLYRRSDTLREVARIVSGDLDLDRALNAILSQLRRVVDYHGATVMLLSADGRPEIQAAADFDPDVDWEQVGRKLRGNLILQKIIDSQKAFVVTDTQDHPDWTVTEASRHVRAFIGTPLIARERVIGTLNVYHIKPAAYDREAAEVVEAFAEQVAVAIENARLFGAEASRRSRAELLHRISLLLASPQDLDQLLGEALDQLADVIHYEAADVVLIDGERAVFVAARGKLIGAVPDSMPVAQMPLVAPLVRTGQPKLVEDIENDPDVYSEWASSQGLICWIGAPMVTRDGVVGVLSIYREAPYSLTQDDVQVAQTLANYLAALVHNRRLLE